MKRAVKADLLFAPLQPSPDGLLTDLIPSAPALTVTERAFLQRLKERRVPEPEREVRFSPDRRWRFDWSWSQQKLALEVEGGVWTGGRHTRGGGFLADCEKYNDAAVRGWRLLRVQPRDLANYATVDLIQRALNYAG